MEIFEDARTVSRADLAAWLRQLANQLESGGKIFYGAGGAVAVADEVHCELEIERDGSEMSVEIEFTWASPKVAEPAGTFGDEDEDKGEEENEKEHEPEPEEKAGTAGKGEKTEPAEAAPQPATPAGATSASGGEGTADGEAEQGSVQ